MKSPYEPAIGSIVLYIPHKSHVEKGPLAALIIGIPKDCLGDIVTLKVMAPAGDYTLRGVPYGIDNESWHWPPSLVARPLELPKVDLDQHSS